MTSLLRQIVASPRARHPDSNLDLCYVTPTLIATSGPTSTYPQSAYRTPVRDLVRFLDAQHGENWCIWEFRAEGTGYPDSEVYGRVRHWPWPDHHPPPFGLLPGIVGGMRNWLMGGEGKEGRVAVVHCKAGKGRSGTVSCSYLISEEGWTAEEAMARFTERRMRGGFGVGISIPSQRRWIGYVERWANVGKKVYVERAVEVVEVHCWGLRDGVKIVVEGFAEEGKVIKKFHTFTRGERTVVRGAIREEKGFADAVVGVLGRKRTVRDRKVREVVEESKEEKGVAAVDGVSQRHSTDDMQSQRSTSKERMDPEGEGGDVIFKPSQRVILPTSDINIDVERRNRTNLGGLTMVTSVAHVWINTFFEGRGPEQGGVPDDSGVFEIAWEAMDGIKGSSRKGTASFDRMAVVWKAVVDGEGREGSVVVREPEMGGEVPQKEAADWRGGDEARADPGSVGKKLGLREGGGESGDVSRAGSVRVEKDESKDDGPAGQSQVVEHHGPGECQSLKPQGEHRNLPGSESAAPQTMMGKQWAQDAHINSPSTHAHAADANGMPELVNGTKHPITKASPDDGSEHDTQEPQKHATDSPDAAMKRSS